MNLCRNPHVVHVGPLAVCQNMCHFVPCGRTWTGWHNMALFGRYDVERSLGQGGAGEVLLVRDCARGGQRMALKRIRARVDELLKAAFEREFSVMASLSLPGVAEVYDFGVVEGDAATEGGPFFTRRYIEGDALDEAASGLATEQRLSLFVRLCEVIAPLHRVGVIHGDLKPGNIIVERDGRVSVIDFGLSRVVDDPRAAGALGGTPPFMAPENLSGSALTTASDVYALGTLLWLLVVERLPFAELGHGASGAKLSGKIPRMPSGLNQTQEEALKIAARAICADPMDRFPTVGELMQALTPLCHEQRAAERDVFVPPRPRGREDVLATLEQELLPTGSGTLRHRIRSLVAPQGMGKTLLLRELKWRLQLRGVHVIELFATQTQGQPAYTWLLQQLAFAAGQGEIDDKDSLSPADAIKRIETCLGTLTSRGTTVFLVDDLHLSERALGDALRSILYDECGESTALLATTASQDAPAVAALSVEQVFALGPLSDDVVSELARDVLAGVDASVLSALVDLVKGVPAALIEALVPLSQLATPTAADVQALQPGEAGAALARERLRRVDAEASDLVTLISLVDAVPTTIVGDILGASASNEIARLQEAALVTAHGASLRLSDRALAQTWLMDLGSVAVQLAARRLLQNLEDTALGAVALAHLAVAARDAEAIRRHVPSATKQLHQSAAYQSEISLLSALIGVASGEERGAAVVELAEALQALGQHEECVEQALPIAGDTNLPQSQRMVAALLAARSLAFLTRYDEAVDVLSFELGSTTRAQRVRTLRELARVHLRRGDYDAAIKTAEEGLESVEQDDVAGVELLCCLGLVAGYRDDPGLAKQHYERALALARKAESRADEAKVLSYLAIGCFRAGELEEARTLLSEALDIARDLGDVAFMANASLNLGAILFYLGEAGEAELHYQRASRLSRRAGSVATDLQARNNLAHVHVYFGLYEQARSELSSLARDAERAEHRYVQAQMQAVRGDLWARTGDVERALIAYDDAMARYRALGQLREVAEHSLDAAEALLDRDGPADVSAAVARLASARSLIVEHKLEDLKLRQELLTARARLASGEAETVLADLESLVHRAQGPRSNELRWMALVAAARAHRLLGAEFAAESHLRRAVELLEEQAVKLPRDHRDAFWHDPRRRAVRKLATSLADSVHRSTPERSETVMSISDPRMTRLLDIIKRLAAEHVLSRLLERITDAAIELSGAERGFVLLVGDDGKLAPQVSRGRDGAEEDPTVAFSRSIAEAVLIDGESIVTIDATHDGRLREYVSVHQLSLRSVACLPIRSPERTVGVLYLEHRRSRGCFTEARVELLHAFADQAAIALNNTRLAEENTRRQSELEAANQELAIAKLQLEEALSISAEKLHEVQDELSRSGARGGLERYGMVGSSPAMMRVYTLVERLKDAHVPVVIRGESGVGKELVARALHYGGMRSKEPFVAVNCGALPEPLLESELFGHVRGAFSGADRERTGLIARAHGGTLFLDEVSDMPAKMQMDLLRVLQEGKVCKIGSDREERIHVRVVAASQHDLKERVEAGLFREDLYYRLNVVEIDIPPLRSRREDLLELSQHFLHRFAVRDGLPEKRLSPHALRALALADLKGNVRELEHRLMQAVLLAKGTSLLPEDLGLEPPAEETTKSTASEFEPFMRASVVTGANAGFERTAGNLDEFRELEKSRILATLEACNWNRARAAKAMGMARRTFYRRLQDYQIL